MKRSELKEMIDGMVAESIRRLLPEIMNEILLRTVANSGIMTESLRSAPSAPPPARKPKHRRPPTNLREIFDESAGAEFYQQQDYGIGEMHEERQPAAPPRLAQRIKDFSPELQMLAEDTVTQMMRPEPTLDLDLAEEAGFDFDRMRQAIGVVEKKSVPLMKDPAAEERRIARLREQLEVKPGN